jgi:hypothetical protein
MLTSRPLSSFDLRILADLPMPKLAHVSSVVTAGAPANTSA